MRSSRTIPDIPSSRGHAAGEFSGGQSGSARRRARQRGATTVAAAASVAAVVATAALVIDIGQLLVTKAELQMVADLSAKSAARELARVYSSSGRTDPATDTLTGAEHLQVAAAADRRGLRNTAGTVPISVPGADVQIGRWDAATGRFLTGGFGVNAVQVVARRDDTSNGKVRMLLPGIFGHESVAMQATAAARISGISYLPRGTADFPVAIAKAWYRVHNSPCETGNRITFQPTGTPEGCVGWHTFQNEPANASALMSILDGLRTGTFVSPEIDITRTQFIFNGGTVTSAINQVAQLYNAKKNGRGELPVLIPVYDRDDCSNPNGWIRIIGVARAVITNVDLGGDKRIEARVECDILDLGESGGPDFGVLSAGPELMQ